jgi:hypothetical protein
LKDKATNNESTILELLETYMKFAKDLCPTMKEITLDSMAEKQYHHIQKTISNAIQKQLEEAVDQSVAQGRVAGGAEMNYADLDPWQKEQAIQHMANKEPFNYAFLVANPCAKLCSMSNQAFCVTIQHRLLLPIGKDYKFCKCGSATGPMFSHCYVCKSVRNGIRNTLHKDLKVKFSDIVKLRINQANLNRRVLSDEPKLEDYFNRLNPPPDPPNEVNHSQYSVRGVENGVKVRADMAIQMTDLNENIVIDFTFVEPTAKLFTPYNKVGQAALKGKENKIKTEYKDWNISSAQVTNKFLVLAIETFGTIISEDFKNLFSQFIHEREDRTRVLEIVFQQLSVAFHSLRAKQFLYIKNHVALRELEQSQRTVRNTTL